MHTAPSDHTKRWGLSVLFYNISFSLLTIMTSNHPQPLHTCRGVRCSPSPVQLLMTDFGAFLQIKQPLSLFPSALLLLQRTPITFTGAIQKTAIRRQKKLCALHAHSPFKLRRSTQQCTPLLEEESTQHGQEQVRTDAQFLVS